MNKEKAHKVLKKIIGKLINKKTKIEKKISLLNDKKLEIENKITDYEIRLSLIKY
jgi:hypothetical protein